MPSQCGGVAAVARSRFHGMVLPAAPSSGQTGTATHCSAPSGAQVGALPPAATADRSPGRRQRIPCPPMPPGLPVAGRTPVDGQARFRPGQPIVEAWHSTLEFGLRPVEHFATEQAARARSAPGSRTATTPQALGLPDDVPADYERALAEE